MLLYGLVIGATVHQRLARLFEFNLVANWRIEIGRHRCNGRRRWLATSVGTHGRASERISITHERAERRVYQLYMFNRYPRQSRDWLNTV